MGAPTEKNGINIQSLLPCALFICGRKWSLQGNVLRPDVVVFTDKRINYSCTNTVVSNIFNVLPEKPNITYAKIAMISVCIVNLQIVFKLIM